MEYKLYLTVKSSWFISLAGHLRCGVKPYETEIELKDVEVEDLLSFDEIKNNLSILEIGGLSQLSKRGEG